MLGWLWRKLVGRFRLPKVPDYPPLPPLPPIQAKVVCYHIWKTDKTVNLYTDVADKSTFVGSKKEMVCTKCGDWKVVKL